MPKETFFHLTDEKKKRIMKAAEREFARMPLKDASISNIIKDAGIPRGSFYQYFEDKEDLYYYYFNDMRKSSTRDLLKSIQAEEGDLFAGFERYFSKMIDTVLMGRHAKFYRNLFMNMDYRAFNRVSPEMSENRLNDRRIQREKHIEIQQEMFAVIDRSTLRIRDDHELNMLIHMLMHTVYSAVIDGYRHLSEDETYEVSQSIQDFKTKVRWMKLGAYQQPSKETKSNSKEG